MCGVIMNSKICDYADIDELKVFHGYDIRISDKIAIRQPTLEEVCNYGERQYFSMVYNLTSVGADMKFQLWDLGIDYTEINDFDLFYSFLYRGYTQKQTEILFGDLDLSKMRVYERKKDKSRVLYDAENEITIDEFTYMAIMDVLRQMHGFKRNSKIPANKSTKMILIEDDREDYLRNKNKPYHSQMKNLISALVNCEGFKYNYETVFDLKINVFLDASKRLQKIKNADLLLQSGYSGFGIKLKDVPKKDIDWMGELN